MHFIWNNILIEPILNFLVFLHNVLPGHDLGIAIIIITVIIRLATLPFSLKSARAQRKMKELAPQLNELKEKHKHDQKELAKAQMEFYKQNGVSPLGSCLPVLIQLPILIALYTVLREGLTHINPEQIYSFITLPEKINATFLGILDLSKPEKYVLPVLAGGLQYILGIMTMPTNKGEKASPEQAVTKQMLYMMPLLTVFLAISVPAGLTLYWVATTLFSVIQQIIVNKEKNKQVKVKIRKASDGEEEIYLVEEKSPSLDDSRDKQPPENESSNSSEQKD